MNCGECRGFRRALRRLDHRQTARDPVGGGRGMAGLAAAEPELALEAAAPEIVGVGRRRQGRARRPRATGAGMLDQTAAVERRVDRRARRRRRALPEPARRELAELARASARMRAPKRRDPRLDRHRQPVRHPPGLAGTLGERLRPVRLPARERLAPGLPRDAELPARRRHRLALWVRATKRGRSSMTMLHPRHPRLPPRKGGRRNPWVRCVP